jgi:hypothetical protein
MTSGASGAQQNLRKRLAASQNRVREGDRFARDRAVKCVIQNRYSRGRADKSMRGHGMLRLTWSSRASSEWPLPGSRLDEREWENATATALSRDYVVQEAIDLHTEQFPIFSDRDWKLRPMFVDTNPFLFRGNVCGAMIRLSSSPIVNVTSGGGETGFFGIEDAA